MLLDSLPVNIRAELAKDLVPVNLPVPVVLFKEEQMPRHVHFITSGMASMVTTMEDGEPIEVGLTGREGFAERFQVLGSQVGSVRCFMQVSGTGLQMDFNRFQTLFLETPALLRAVHQYVQHDSLVLAQLAACNRRHEVEARLARWLLMVEDRVGQPELRLTQEFLGQMLGARRSSVNLAANSLQHSGVITYSRGKIVVLNRALLESVACECYPIVARLYKNLYKPSGSAAAK